MTAAAVRAFDRSQAKPPPGRGHHHQDAVETFSYLGHERSS